MSNVKGNAVQLVYIEYAHMYVYLDDIRVNYSFCFA